MAHQPAVCATRCGPPTGRTVRLRARRPIRRRSPAPTRTAPRWRCRAWPRTARSRSRRPSSSSLRRLQNPNGGFPFLAATGQKLRPRLHRARHPGVARGESRPRNAGRSPRCPRFQLGCPDPVAYRGAYFFPGSRTPNLFATVQAVPAQALRPLPIAASTPSADVPVRSCPASTSRRRRNATLTAATAHGRGETRRHGGSVPGQDRSDRERRLQGVRSRNADPVRARGPVVGIGRACNTRASRRRARVATASRSSAGSTTGPTPAQQACVTTPPANCVLGVLPRACGRHDVDVLDGRRVVVQAAARQHRRLGVRQAGEAHEDAGAGAVRKVAAESARRRGSGAQMHDGSVSQSRDEIGQAGAATVAATGRRRRGRVRAARPVPTAERVGGCGTRPRRRGALPRHDDGRERHRRRHEPRARRVLGGLRSVRRFRSDHRRRVRARRDRNRQHDVAQRRRVHPRRPRPIPRATRSTVGPASARSTRAVDRSARRRCSRR